MVKIKPRHDRTAPRGWFSLFWAAGGLIAMIGGVFLLGATYFSVSNYAKAARFDANGVAATATATERRIRRDPDPEDSDDYYVTFAYDAAGEPVVIERKVTRSFYHSADQGTQHSIRYLPQSPRVMEYYVGEMRDKARGTQIFALVAGLLALIGLWYFGRRANSAILTRKYGYKTTARISDFVERKRSGRRTGRGYMIFHTEDGLRGESLDHSIGTLRALGAGSEVIVYVRKGTVWWEGDVGPRRLDRSRVPKVE